jgi:hypothetical protein
MRQRGKFVPRNLRHWFLAALAVQTLQAGSVFSQETDPSGPIPLDLNLLDRWIADSLQRKPELAGAWLFVNRDDAKGADTERGTLVFRRVLDRANADAQRRELDQLVKSWLPEGGYFVDSARDHEYPFSELIHSLQESVEANPRLGGCAVASAHYAVDASVPDKLELVLLGRIAKEGQDVEIESLCGRLMRGEPAWVAPELEGAATSKIALEISPRSSELKVVEPSPSHGRLFYSRGLSAFWKRQYSRASESFRQAALESPRKIEYYYWWSLSDLAAGDNSTAAQRMRTVVKRFRETDFDRESTEYRAVVRSLERVQGPLRRALLELESKALFADSQTSPDE